MIIIREKKNSFMQRKLVACSHGNTDSYTKLQRERLQCSTHPIRICLGPEEDYCHKRSGKCNTCAISTANTNFCLPLYMFTYMECNAEICIDYAGRKGHSHSCACFFLNCCLMILKFRIFNVNTFLKSVFTSKSRVTYDLDTDRVTYNLDIKTHKIIGVVGSPLYLATPVSTALSKSHLSLQLKTSSH